MAAPALGAAAAAGLQAGGDTLVRVCVRGPRRGAVRRVPQHAVHLFPVLAGRFAMEPKRAGFDYVGLVVPADGVMESSQSTTAQAGERRVAAFPGAGRLAAFFTLLVILFFVADFLIDTGLRRIPTGPFGVYNRLMIGDIDAEVLVTGSSRALNGFDPRVIHSETGARAYNIGINGSQTDMQVAVLKTSLRHNPKPALIVHSLDSFSFVTSRSGVWFPGQYMPYLQEDGIYDGLRAVDRDAWKARYLPLYGYAVEDMNFTWLA